MRTTNKETARMLAEGLKGYGCRRVVVSPGSRDVPLIMAFARDGGYRLHTVIDERSAAFIALGMAEVSGEPVALVCTSGTAMLNYAPALAEAYYKKLSLIAITADRPAERIGQDDSQTIRQPGALSNIVKKECALKGELSGLVDINEANRNINEILTAAVTGRRGPVHINVSFNEPLSEEAETGDLQLFRKVELIGAEPLVTVEKARELACRLHGKRVMIVGGFHAPSAKLNRAFARLSKLENVVVVAEQLANLKSGDILSSPDRLFVRAGNDAARLYPDVFISFGGALVSKSLKNFIRESGAREHWHIGSNEMAIDCHRLLTTRIELPAEGFFPRLAGAMEHIDRIDRKSATSPKTGYAALWRGIEKRSAEHLTDYMLSAQWSDMKAVEMIAGGVPEGWNLQLSNGMSVRYAQLFSLGRFHRVDCNRGVSGIDGSVSTAVGASAVYQRHPTLLITGDMSMQYDISALSSAEVGPRLKIVVISNGGGGIFRLIKTTRALPEKEDYLACSLNLPLQKLAEAYGLRYLRAENEAELSDCLGTMAGTEDAPVLLEVVTDGEKSAEVYSRYIASGNEK